MTPKKYIHPQLDRIAIQVADGFSIYSDEGEYEYDVEHDIVNDMHARSPLINVEESMLLPLGFIEAPTDTEEKVDWIDKIIDELDICDKYIVYGQDGGAIDKKSIRQLIEKHKPMPFDNEYYKKPVEQELIPLLPRDIVAITDEIITLDELGKVDEDRIHKILSKYGVLKQEANPFKFEDTSMPSYSSGTKAPNQTPQATSVIDIDKEKSQNRFEIMIHDIESIMYTQLNTLRDSQTHDNRISIAKGYIKKRQEQGLLPIQKKFTRQQLEKFAKSYNMYGPTEDDYLVKSSHRFDCLLEFLKREGLLSD